MGSTVSDVARKVASGISPGLQRDAIDNRDVVLSGIPGAMFRMAARQAYPYIVDQIPTTTGLVCDRMLTAMESMTVFDIVDMVRQHAAQKGESVNADLRNYRPQLQQVGEVGSGSEIAAEDEETDCAGEGGDPSEG
jgi:molybdopterin-biosynthesis enzyme MoeA-like protein